MNGKKTQATRFLSRKRKAEIGEVFRNALAYGTLIVLNIIVISVYQNARLIQTICAALIVYPVVRLGIGVGLLDPAMFFGSSVNVGFLVILVALAAIFQKERIFQLMILLTISSHMITLAW